MLWRDAATSSAIESFREALRLNPRFAAAYNNLGSVLKGLGRNGEALVCFEEALEHDANVQAHNGVGAVLQSKERPDEALAAYERAVELKPDYAEAHTNIGELMGEQGKFDLALQRFDRARVQARSGGRSSESGNHAVAVGPFCRGLARVRMAAIQCRISQGLLAPTALGWRAVGGALILLQAEQGLGDTLQFVRYVPLVQQRGGKVLLVCTKRLIPLLRGSPASKRSTPKASRFGRSILTPRC